LAGPLKSEDTADACNEEDPQTLFLAVRFKPLWLRAPRFHETNEPSNMMSPWNSNMATILQRWSNE